MVVDRIGRAACVLACALSLLASSGGGAVRAQEAPPDAPASAASPAESGVSSGILPKIRFGFEGRLNFRSSDEYRFPVKFGFDPTAFPPGQNQIFEETVNSGSHFEVSKLILFVDADWSENLTAHGRLDFIDLYDRNPTSSGKKTDVKELYVRFGREDEPGVLPKGSGAYFKVGKFSHFERQNDRHLESYGLVSTTFNRFNDMGAELGVDAGRHLYFKVSATAGNPVFLRDPNALAGDNGQPELLQKNPNPELKSGVVILYDTEVEDYNPKRNPQLSGAIGLRFGDEGGRNALDVLLFGHRRTLSDQVSKEGTFYKGDLQILRGPFNLASLPIHGNVKQEVGGNVWLYLGNFSLFTQYVNQKLAGLPREGYEAEAAWTFDLPLVWAVDGRQLFPTIAPSVRWSKLDNHFKNPPKTPAPSFGWDWTKIDAGVRLGIVPGIDLTFEYAFNNFVLGSGAIQHENEFLSTLRFHI
jgi:hypothetical protein